MLASVKYSSGHKRKFTTHVMLALLHYQKGSSPGPTLLFKTLDIVYSVKWTAECNLCALNRSASSLWQMVSPILPRLCCDLCAMRMTQSFLELISKMPRSRSSRSNCWPIARPDLVLWSTIYAAFSGRWLKASSVRKTTASLRRIFFFLKCGRERLSYSSPCRWLLFEPRAITAWCVCRRPVSSGIWTHLPKGCSQASSPDAATLRRAPKTSSAGQG